MTEVMVYGESLPEAYHESLSALYSLGKLIPCPDYETQRLECSMTICVEHPLQEPMISKLFIGDPESLEQYREEILDGILDFEVEKGNWAYTYHLRAVNEKYDQIQFVIDELRRNPFSCRAIIDVRDNEVDMYSSEPACLQSIQFFVRENELHCKVFMRSNDACKATFMNMFAFICLQEKIANELGYNVGTYTHRANSFHCYAKDFDMFEGYINGIIDSKDNNNPYYICYDYTGDWQELMEDCKENIKAKVEELKER